MRAQDNIYNSSDIRGLLNPSFTEASGRVNINSGESYTTLFGKIKKYFSDLKSGAFNSIKQGTYITVTTNDTTHETEIKHNNSGVTAASKGDTTNQTPGFGSTFKVTSGTVDAQGHFTAFADHTVKIPTISFATGSANGNISVNINGAGATDIKVKGISDLAYIAKGSDNSKYLRSDGSWVKPPNDNTTYTFAEGSTNGAFSVTPSGGSASSIKIHGLGSLAYKSSLTKSDVTTALGYTPPTSDTNTTYTIATGDSNGQIKVTPSSGSAYNVNIKGLGSAAYTASSAYASSSHNHDSTYLKLSGGTMTGNITMTPGSGEQAVGVRGDNFVCYGSDSNGDVYIKHGARSAQKDLDIVTTWLYVGSSSGSAANIFFGNETSVLWSKTLRSGYGNSPNTMIKGDYLNLEANTAIQCRTVYDGGWSDLNCKNVHENSSIRYKKNVKDLDLNEALKILSLRPVTFDYKSGEVDKRGFIAEEVEPLIPGAVSYTELNGTKVPDGLSYTTFIPYLVKMIQIQQEEINELKAKIDNI